MRPIDADELLTAFPLDDEPTVKKSCVRMTIKRMPTIEAEPIKHGRWIRKLDTRFGPMLNDLIICSVCNIAFSTENMIRRSYCPNCGAKMDEGNAEKCWKSVESVGGDNES